MADLGAHPILIVDGEAGAGAPSAGHDSGSGSGSSAGDPSCSVGIESTVVKIDTQGGLRRVGVHAHALRLVHTQPWARVVSH